jgi:hypothetical protein
MLIKSPEGGFFCMHSYPILYVYDCK